VVKKGFVLITGASSGIGSELARVFAREGHPLVLVARSQGRLEDLAGELRRDHGVEVKVLVQDLAQTGAASDLAQALVAEGVEVETLVNNAGFGLLGPFIESDMVKHGEMMRLNMVALTELTRVLVPWMVARGKGWVLNVASTAAFQPGPGMAVYFATKSYVLSFSVALREELKGTGVKVTCLCPGATETRFAEVAQAQGSRLFKRRKLMTAREVAEEGYRALQKGQAVRVTGHLNKLTSYLARLAPLEASAKIAKDILDED
jgi:hypothetical protein